MNFSRGDQFIPNIAKAFTIISIFSATLMMASCANRSQLEKESFSEITKLQNQFEKNTENALYHIKLGNEYEKLGKAKSSNHYFRKAIDEYSKALELEPTNTSLAFSLYQLTYTGVIEWYADIEDLSALYKRIEGNIRKNLNPPHLALFQRESSRASHGTVTEKQLEEILHKAHKENPLNARVSFLLSNFWIFKNHYILGIDILKRSLEEQPDNQFLMMQLGVAYEAYANQNYCPYEHPSELKKSLDFLQKAAKQIPNSPYLNNTLTTLYERMNASILMLDSAKRLVASENSPENVSTLAGAYSNAGQLEKALTLNDELISQGITNAYINKAMILAENGDWQAAYSSAKKYLAGHKPLPIYSALMHLAMEAILDVKKTSLSEMSRYVRTEELDVWEKALFDYWFDAISETELTALADNICKSTESSFLIGIKKLVNPDTKEQARAYFNAVLSSKTYSFVEYRVTQHLIDMLENEPQ